MPNQCFCGRSQMMPWCDGSHDGRDRPEPRAADATAAKPAAPESLAPPPKGWLARLFGRGR
jgi:CDGSH-type Zn-finger protein